MSTLKFVFVDIEKKGNEIHMRFDGDDILYVVHSMDEVYEIFDLFKRTRRWGCHIRDKEAVV